MYLHLKLSQWLSTDRRDFQLKKIKGLIHWLELLCPKGAVKLIGGGWGWGYTHTQTFSESLWVFKDSPTSLMLVFPLYLT